MIERNLFPGKNFYFLNPSELAINFSEPSLSIKWDKQISTSQSWEGTELKVKCFA